MNPFALQLANPDGTGLVALGTRQCYGKDPIAAFGGDAILVDFDRQRDGPIEAALEPLAAMNTGFLRILDCFGA
jgi:hypothetical protein